MNNYNNIIIIIIIIILIREYRIYIEYIYRINKKRINKKRGSKSAKRGQKVPNLNLEVSEKKQNRNKVEKGKK